jgi:nicotinate-nucleotide adenylyltransferase
MAAPRTFSVLASFAAKNGLATAEVEADSLESLDCKARVALGAPQSGSGGGGGGGGGAGGGEAFVQLLDPATDSFVELLAAPGGFGALPSSLQLRVGLRSAAGAAAEGGAAKGGSPAAAMPREVKPRKRIAVLGGSFDPITDGHLKCACEIIHSRCADEVWLTPCGPRPDKPSLKTPVLHRLIMCHLAVNTTFGARFPVYVKDHEAHLEEAMATYHLIEKLQRDDPAADFLFVVGTDLLPGIKDWDAPGVPDAGRKLWDGFAKFLVVDRPGYSMMADLPANFISMVPHESDNITLVGDQLSSSEIRLRLTTPGPSTARQGGRRPSVARQRAASREYALAAAASAEGGGGGGGGGDDDEGDPAAAAAEGGELEPVAPAYGAQERYDLEHGHFSRAEGLVPSAVLAHILRNALYQS